MGGLPCQHWCAFKDPCHVGAEVASQPLSSLLHRPICHLGFHCVCIFMSSSTCKEAWSLGGLPQAWILIIKEDGGSQAEIWDLGLPLSLCLASGLFVVLMSCWTLGLQGRSSVFVHPAPVSQISICSFLTTEHFSSVQNPIKLPII